MSVFGQYAKVYDTLYHDKDYMSEARTVDRLLREYGQDINSILVFGCGTGQHDRCLEKLGYHIHGIDISKEMIEKARVSSSTIEYEVADIRNYESEKTYDAVVSLFHVMSYQNTNNDILSALNSARKNLAKGGVLLFDIWYGPGVLTDRPTRRIKSVRVDDCTVFRVAEPVMHANENIVDIRYDITLVDEKKCIISQMTEDHHMRYFFKPEMENYLFETGFELLACLDCNTCKEPDYDSWTTYFIAKAI